VNWKAKKHFEEHAEKVESSLIVYPQSSQHGISTPMSQTQAGLDSQASTAPFEN
jgi:hypothetical protein